MNTKQRHQNFGLAAVLILSTMLVLVPVIQAYAVGKFKLKRGAEGQLCIKCHEALQPTLKRVSVHPLVKKGNCIACHDPHTSSHKDLLAADAQRLCAGCHTDKVPEKARSIHKVVAEGNCVACHNSHGSDNKYILAKAGNTLCLECHQDIGTMSEKLSFRHEPLQKDKGCLNCHDPHMSARSNFLLTKDVPELCHQCHKTNTAFMAKKHNNYPIAASRCDSCHSPHGSNTRGILYDTVHEPVAKGQCRECHKHATSANVLKIEEKNLKLCRQCHQDTMDQALQKKRLHWPFVGKDGCQNCHTPHGSRAKGLLRGSQVEVCGKCHTDTVNLQEWSKKNPKNKYLCKPVKEGDCQTCHRPHAADDVLLMSNNISVDVCGKCHEWKRHSSHPIGEKVVDHRNKNLTLDCLSCHRGCGTGNKPAMLHFETTYDLCIQCHVERRR